MRRFLNLRLARYAVLSSVLVFLAGTGVGLGIYTYAVRRDRAADATRIFHERLRSGVGQEVRFTRPGDTPGSVRAAVSSLDHFIYSRSGVRLGGQAKAKLAELEERTLSGEYHLLTTDQVADAISGVAIARISTLKDEQIEYAAECLRGFDAPDLPESFRQGRDKVRLRASIAGRLTPGQFADQVKAMREADGVTRAIFLGATKNAVAGEIKGRKQYLGEALPEKFGPPEAGMTPLQAVLITYSVASDDLLSDSEGGLRERMRSIHDSITRRKGVSFPNPDGHFAYGPNGYVFSTPLDLVLDEQTLGALLDRLGERGARQ